MPLGTSSPFARPMPGIRIVDGAPAPSRPSSQEISAFPDEAQHLVRSFQEAQQHFLHDKTYDLSWISDRHFFIAGGTGNGLGGALAIALLHALPKIASLTVVSRDLSRSLPYETGVVMQDLAHRQGIGHRFHWLNNGMSLEGTAFDEIVHTLQKCDAQEVICINAVAAAYSGMLPGYPPVYVLDIDSEGLFQWRLPPLDRRAVEATRFIMGDMAVAFPEALRQASISVGASVFADWRGSLKRQTRDPGSPVYGRQGPYSTSLYLPKDIIQSAVSNAYGTGSLMLDFFLPVMRTRALHLIPGGWALWKIYSHLMRRSGIARAEVPQLALAMLHEIGHAIGTPHANPFPRLDNNEAQLDLWFYELLRLINNNENSDFYFRKWIDEED